MSTVLRLLWPKLSSKDRITRSIDTKKFNKSEITAFDTSLDISIFNQEILTAAEDAL